MFTGIIEEIGTIRSIRQGSSSASIAIEAEKILRDAKVGDSIAVNGICLTVTETHNGMFTADIMSETLKRSSLGRFSAGSCVNLERAMAADGRFGGHMVTGHADGIGKIIRIRRDDIAIWFTIQTKPDIMHCIVEKGSIAIDGISLTVAETNDDNFSVSVIPHTLKHTTLKEKQTGSLVNLESDIVGKYTAKLLSFVIRQPQCRITKDFLQQYAF